VEFALVIKRDAPAGAGWHPAARLEGLIAASNFSHLLETKEQTARAREYITIAIELGEASGLPEGLASAQMYRSQVSREHGLACMHAGRDAEAEASFRRAMDEGTCSGAPDGLRNASL